MDGKKMNIGSFSLHRRAFMALNELPLQDQAEIREQISALAEISPNQWTSQDVKKLDDDPSLYLLRVNASLRVILRAANGQPPEVLDIVRHETLETFANNGR
jgi:hypothetical protein